MDIPRKITPCPIAEAVIGINFESNVPSEAVFGIIYGKLGGGYDPKVESLPILQIPHAIRKQDPLLRDQPYYKLKSGDFILQIGPRVLLFASTIKYVGWKEFSDRMEKIIDSISEIGIIKNVSRLGIRYINFFDFDIYDKINLKLLMGDKPFIAEQVTLRSKIEIEDYTSTLQIVNKSDMMISGKKVFGSVIDIDTSIVKKDGILLKDIKKLMFKGHDEEKKLFFSLLKNDYLQSLNPEY
jgi:hypothetical protein